MIEHSLYNMGKFVFVKKFQYVYELWPTEIFARPGQILGRLQLRQRTFTPLKQPLYGYLTWFFQVNKCFILFGQGWCIFKSQTIFYFDQIIVQNQSWTICWSDLAGKKIGNRHNVMINCENFLDHYYSACKYLQLPFLHANQNCYQS